jgi:hypothetical protein
MHRLVIWGFVLALVPLSLAVAWEAVIMVRGLWTSTPTKESVTRAQALVKDGPQV